MISTCLKLVTEHMKLIVIAQVEVADCVKTPRYVL